MEHCITPQIFGWLSVHVPCRLILIDLRSEEEPSFCFYYLLLLLLFFTSPLGKELFDGWRISGP